MSETEGVGMHAKRAGAERRVLCRLRARAVSADSAVRLQVRGGERFSLKIGVVFPQYMYLMYLRCI